MIRNRRFLVTVVVCATALVMAACNGTTAETSGESAGDPVAGGTARVIQAAEPRSLDPAAMGNYWAHNAVVGNALYGTLLSNDTTTGEIEYRMAESFISEDNGKTFELTLRPGLTFSDGSPLDAEAVKFNWDRIKDPATGSVSISQASMIAATAVVDAQTLKVTLAQPIPNYAQAVIVSSLNWIASPKALRAGQQSFDAKPIGAGPFTLERWARQDRIELVKNPKYWDAPKPYLDRITMRTTVDGSQRIDTVASGGADVAIATGWETVAKARDAGLQVDVVPLHGGQFLAMNTRRAPFNDIRARKAVAAALDMDAMNLAVFNGKGETAKTLFTESSPFSTPDLTLSKPDKATAQRLFDELAAAGKKVSFTFKSSNNPDGKSAAEAVQAQLSAFKNIEVKVEIFDIADSAKIFMSRDFDMVISSAHFADPDPRMWEAFHSRSAANMSGISDPKLDAALNAGRMATTVEQRTAAYRTAQERLIELSPVLFYIRTCPAAAAATNVHGIKQYGWGSLLPEELWIDR